MHGSQDRVVQMFAKILDGVIGESWGDLQQPYGKSLLDFMSGLRDALSNAAASDTSLRSPALKVLRG